MTERRSQQAPAPQVDYSALELPLEALVDYCNNSDLLSNISEVIAAEAALETVYKARLAPAPQAATGEDLAIYDSIARNYMRDGKPATHAEARIGFPKDGTK